MKNEATCTTDEQISGYDSKNTVCASYAHPAGGCSKFRRTTYLSIILKLVSKPTGTYK
jgi:hypothetical protein